MRKIAIILAACLPIASSVVLYADVAVNAGIGIVACVLPIWLWALLYSLRLYGAPCVVLSLALGTTIGMLLGFLGGLWIGLFYGSVVGVIVGAFNEKAASAVAET